MDIRFVPAQKEEYASLAQFIARQWHTAYDGLLGEAQVKYMTDTFQSAAAIERQVREEGYLYYYIEGEGRRIGYCALHPEKEKLFLSKLYLTEEERGRGIGQKALAAVAEIAAERGLKAVYLTVNTGNARAVRAYEKFGFTRTDHTVTDIGSGFVMDDYIYEYRI